MKLVLKKYPDTENPYDYSTVEITGELEDLSSALELYSDFLKACGFSIDGQLVIENTEEQLNFNV